MGIIDTIFLLLFIVFMLIGFFKGFLKQVFSTLAWVIALVAATIFSKPVGIGLSGTNIGLHFNANLIEWIASKGEIFSKPMNELTSEYVNTALSNLGIPKFLQEFLLNMIDFTKCENVSIAEIIGPKILNMFLIIISFVVIYLIVFLIVKLLGKLSGRIVRGSALGVVDGALGALWCGVKVTIFVSLFMLLLSAISTMPFGVSINEWITTDMKLAEEGFGIGKFFYEYNPIIYFINLLPFWK